MVKKWTKKSKKISSQKFFLRKIANSKKMLCVDVVEGGLQETGVWFLENQILRRLRKVENRQFYFQESIFLVATTPPLSFSNGITHAQDIIIIPPPLHTHKHPSSQKSRVKLVIFSWNQDFIRRIFQRVEWIRGILTPNLVVIISHGTLFTPHIHFRNGKSSIEFWHRKKNISVHDEKKRTTQK